MMTAPVRRYLIVANQTTNSPALRAAIESRLSDGPARFFVLVPTTGASELARLTAMAVDPLHGTTFCLPDLGGDDEPRVQAETRLAAQLREIRDLGGEADGSIGAEDPIGAIAELLDREAFDEILLSTLPAGVSRWLSLDLPHRAARKFPVPVTHVEAVLTTTGK
jgi:hypothetical protein